MWSGVNFTIDMLSFYINGSEMDEGMQTEIYSTFLGTRISYKLLSSYIVFPVT